MNRKTVSLIMIGLLIVSGLGGLFNNMVRDRFSTAMEASEVVQASGSRMTSTTAVGSTTSVVLNKPSDVSQGNFMIGIIAFNKGTSVTVTPPSGWTLVKRSDAADKVGSASYYKIATSSEPSTYTWTLAGGDKWAAGLTRILGVNPTTPIQVSAVNNGASSVSHVAPSVTTLADSTMVLCHYTHEDELTYTPAGGTFEIYDVPYSASDKPGNMLSWFMEADPVATGSKTATVSSPAKWATQTIALNTASPFYIDPVMNAGQVQEVIDNAQDGDTIIWRNGTHSYTMGDFINSAITLTKENLILKGSGSTIISISNLGKFIGATSKTATIQDMTIHGCIMVTGTSYLTVNNLIMDTNNNANLATVTIADGLLTLNSCSFNTTLSQSSYGLQANPGSIVAENTVSNGKHGYYTRGSLDIINCSITAALNGITWNPVYNEEGHLINSSIYSMNQGINWWGISTLYVNSSNVWANTYGASIQGGTNCYIRDSSFGGNNAAFYSYSETHAVNTSFTGGIAAMYNPYNKTVELIDCNLSSNYSWALGYGSSPAGNGGILTLINTNISSVSSYAVLITNNYVDVVMNGCTLTGLQSLSAIGRSGLEVIANDCDFNGHVRFSSQVTALDLALSNCSVVGELAITGYATVNLNLENCEIEEITKGNYGNGLTTITNVSSDVSTMDNSNYQNNMVIMDSDFGVLSINCADSDIEIIDSNLGSLGIYTEDSTTSIINTTSDLVDCNWYLQFIDSGINLVNISIPEGNDFYIYGEGMIMSMDDSTLAFNGTAIYYEGWADSMFYLNNSEVENIADASIFVNGESPMEINDCQIGGKVGLAVNEASVISISNSNFENDVNSIVVGGDYSEYSLINSTLNATTVIAGSANHISIDMNNIEINGDLYGVGLDGSFNLVNVLDSSLSSANVTFSMIGSSNEVYMNQVELMCNYSFAFVGDTYAEFRNVTFGSANASVLGNGSLIASFWDCTFDIVNNSIIFLALNDATVDDSEVYWLDGNVILEANYTFVNVTEDNYDIWHNSTLDFDWETSEAGTGRVRTYLTSSVRVGSETGISVRIEDSPYHTVMQGDTNAGFAELDYVLESKVQGGKTRFQYIFRITLPTSWNLLSVRVRNLDTSTNLTFYNTGNEIHWFGYLGNYFVTEATTDVTMGFEGGNSTLNNSVAQNSTATTVNRLVFVNNNPIYTFRTFNLTVGTFTGSIGTIEMKTFSVKVFLDGKEWLNLNAVNGWVNFSTIVPYSSNLMFSFSFAVPTYVKAGNYSAPWYLQATNGTTFTGTGTTGLTILGTPAITVTYAGGNTACTFQTGIQAGITTNVWTTLESKLQVANTGNTALKKIEFSGFSTLGSGTIPLTNKLRIYSQENLITTTWDGSTPILFDYVLFNPNPLVYKTFRFIVTDTPVGVADGTYSGTGTVKGVMSDGTKTAGKTVTLSMTVSASNVQIEVKYSREPEATTPEFTTDGLQFGTIMPGATNVQTNNWVYIKNTGNLAISRLELTWSDLTNAQALEQIDVRQVLTTVHGYSIDKNGNPTAIPSTGIVSYSNLNLASGSALWFRLRIASIPSDQFACSYTGQLGILAVYTPASRLPGEIFATAVAGVNMPGDESFSEIEITASDDDSAIRFDSPISVDQEANNHLVIQNRGGWPVDSIRVNPTSSSPAEFVVVYDGMTYQPNELIIFEDMLPFGASVEVFVVIAGVDGTYSPVTTYVQDIEVTYSRWIGFRDEISGGTFPLVLGGGEPGFALNLHFGMNAICWPGDSGSGINKASDFFGLGSDYLFVGTWNKVQSRWQVCRGVTNDFDLERGMGLWVSVRNPNGATLEFSGGVNTTVNYTITNGLNFVGNPTLSPKLASEMIENSTDIFLVAKWVGNTYLVYRPSSPTPVDFTVQPGEGVWISTRETADVVRYEA